MKRMSDMNEEVMRPVRAVQVCLANYLGERLQALYLYGSLAAGLYQPEESDINILAVVADEAAAVDPSGSASFLHSLAAAFAPVWLSCGSLLRRAPVVVTRSAWLRHLQLNPVLASRLRDESSLLTGVDLLPPVVLAPGEWAAYWATEATRASAALAPQLLAEKEALLAQQRLRRLVRSLSRRPVLPAETPGALFAEAQSHLAAMVAGLPAIKATISGRQPGAPPLMPRLQAIYERSDTAILVFPDLTTGEWSAIDWGEVAGLLQNQYARLEVTTAAQLRLSLAQEQALTYSLMGYDHAWGATLLENLPVSRRATLREAARLPSTIQTTALPGAYLSGKEAYQLIHDFQNRLLNVHLRHELLVRIHGLAPAVPSEALPEKEAPTWQRIDAILDHAAWWADYYTGLMAASDQ
jgi:hypothetical protein